MFNAAEIKDSDYLCGGKTNCSGSMCSIPIAGPDQLRNVLPLDIETYSGD